MKAIVRCAADAERLAKQFSNGTMIVAVADDYEPQQLSAVVDLLALPTDDDEIRICIEQPELRELWQKLAPTAFAFRSAYDAWRPGPRILARLCQRGMQECNRVSDLFKSIALFATPHHLRRVEWLACSRANKLLPGFESGGTADHFFQIIISDPAAMTAIDGQCEYRVRQFALATFPFDATSNTGRKMIEYLLFELSEWGRSVKTFSVEGAKLQLLSNGHFELSTLREGRTARGIVEASATSLEIDYWFRNLRACIAFSDALADRP